MPHELTIEKSIAVPASRVFNAFTNSEQLSAWFTTKAVVDLSVGGQYSNADGDYGKYLEIIPNKKIVFTWENPGHCPGTEVTIDFKSEDDNSCRVILVHRKLATADHVRDMNSGWSWALNNVKLWLETGRKIGYEEWLANKV